MSLLGSEETSAHFGNGCAIVTFTKHDLLMDCCKLLLNVSSNVLGAVL